MIEIDFSWNPQTFEDGFTQSELGMLDDCPRKHNLKYNNRLDRKNAFEWNFWIGTAWHKFQEEWRMKEGNVEVLETYFPPIPIDIIRDSEFEKMLDYWTVIIPIYQQEYAKFYKGEEKEVYPIIEKEISAEFLGIKIRGMLDLVNSKKRFIRDFKTTSSAWFIAPDGWHFKLQFMIYCWLAWQNDPKWVEKGPFDFQLDIMQKPNLKQTQKETWVQHINRVKADIIDRPEHYFIRKSQTIEIGLIKHFENTVLRPKIERLVYVQNDEYGSTLPFVENPNTNHCNAYNRQCEFFEVCEKGWKVGQFHFERREVKHKELE